MSTDERISLETRGKLLVNYAAPPLHCSDVINYLSADGRDTAVTPTIKPGEESGFVNLGPVASGMHSISLRAEGVVGGCNHGMLAAWGSSVEVLTSTAGDVFSNLGRIVFESQFENFAWQYVNKGCTIASDGSSFSWSVQKKPARNTVT